MFYNILQTSFLFLLLFTSGYFCISLPSSLLILRHVTPRMTCSLPHAASALLKQLKVSTWIFFSPFSGKVTSPVTQYAGQCLPPVIQFLGRVEPFKWLYFTVWQVFRAYCSVLACRVAAMTTPGEDSSSPSLCPLTDHRNSRKTNSHFKGGGFSIVFSPHVSLRVGMF